MIEDIIDQEPFVGHLEWRIEEGLPWDGPLVPSDSTAASRLVQRHADGAASMVSHYGRLSEFRRRAIGAFKELVN